MDEKELQALYNAMSKQFDVGDWNTFRSKMQTTGQRRNFYDAISSNGYDLGGYEEYEHRLAGVKKKEPSGLGSKIGGEVGTLEAPSPLGRISKVAEAINRPQAALSVSGNTTGELPKEKKTYEFDINDPYGKISEQIDADITKVKEKPLNYTNPNNVGRYQSYQQKEVDDLNQTKEQLKDYIFPTASLAKKWLYSKGDKVDDNNKTDKLAKDVIIESENVKSAIANSGGDLQQAAFDYYATRDDQFRALKEGGLTPPPKVAAELEYSFLQDKNVIELANESQDFRNLYKERADNFYSNHPDMRVKKIVSQIAQGREDFGYNNPFLNLTGVKSSDKVIEELFGKGDIDRFDKEFYYEKVRPLIAVHAVQIPTTGLIESTAQSALKGLLDIPKGFNELVGLRNLTTTKAERAYDILEEEADMVGVQAKGINKVSHATGNLAGVLLPIAGGAKLLKAANIVKNASTANELMMGLTFYHDLQKEAEKTNPNDAWGNHVTALIQSAVYMKIAKAFPKLSGDIISKAKPEIQEVLAKLRNNEITGAAATQSITETVLNSAGKIGGGTLKLASEMSLAVGINDAVSGIFSGKFDADTTLQNMGHTFESMLLGAPLLQIASLRGSRRTMAADILNGISEKPDFYREQIQRQAELDPEFAKKAPEMLANLDKVVELKNVLAEREDLTEKQKRDFILVEMQQSILNNKIKESPSKLLTTNDAKKVEELEIEKKLILEPDTSNTKIVQEFYDNELLGKQSMENLSVRDESGKPTNKFDESKVGEFLKEAAQRLNNLDAEWNPNKGGDSSKAAKEAYPEAIQEIANSRWEKEINQSKEKLIDQERELDMGDKELTKEETQPKEVKPITEEQPTVSEPLEGKGEVSTVKTKEEGEGSLGNLEKAVNLQDKTSKDANDIITGKKVFERLSPEEERGRTEGGKANVEATLLLTGLQKAGDKNSTTPEGQEAILEETKKGEGQNIPTQSKEESTKSGEIPTLEAEKKISDGEKQQEPPPIKPTEGKVEGGEGDVRGITHAANEVRRKDRALPEYQREPQSFEQWNNEAEQKIKDGYDVEKLMDEIEAGKDPTPVENAIRKIYVATLDAEIAKNPTDALLAKQKRFIKIGDLANSRAGRNLVSLKGEGSPLETISDFYVAKMEAAGVDKLTEQQKRETKEAFDNVQKADKNATEAMEAYREEIAKLKAENELLRQKKSTTKKGDFKQQRKDAIEGAREALRKLRTGESGLSAVPLPGVRELIAVAPHVKKYVGALLGEGAYTLKEVVTKAYEEFKDILEGITEKDIHNIIAGEYNEKKPTRNELAARMRDLKDEAYYINKLEKLLKGKEPTNEKKRVQRNRQITELQQKIKDFIKEKRESEKIPKEPKTPKEEKDSDLKKLEAIKKRNETETLKLKERIAKGDFETKKKVPFLEDPEMQKKFPREYKAALDAIVAREEARHEFDIALMKDQMAKRSVAKKGVDLAGDVIGTTKALVTGIDASGIGIQNLVAMIAHPRSAAKALPASFGDFISAQRMDRWLASVHNSELFPLAKKAGLDITEPKSLKASEREELFTHNLLDRRIKFRGKTYVISKYTTKPFERIFTGLGNRMRWNLWARGVQKLYEEGYTWESHPDQFKSLAKILNTETGRGTLHKQVENAYGFISAGIWSPRLMASRLNILGLGDLFNLAAGGKKGYYGGLTPKMRAYAIKDFAKFVTFGGTMLALAGLTFADDTDTDPNSPTFGTFSANGKRYNMWGGFTQYVRLATKLAKGGEKVKGEFRPSNQLKTSLRFLWSKTTPAVGTAIGLMNKENKDYMGQPITAEGAAESMLIPLSIRGIAQGIEREGLGSVFWTGIPSFVGMNVNYESDFEDNRMTPEERKDPIIKEFTDKGIRFPNFNPDKIQTKEVNGKVTEYLSDYPKEVQEKYIDAKKKYFKEELEMLKNGDYEVYRDYDGTVHIRTEKTKEDEVKEDVSYKNLTPEEIQYLVSTYLSGNATRKAKEDVELKK